nr:hypothetical protein [uncultured Flavobacterium sp.]
MNQIFSQPNKPFYEEHEWEQIINSCSKYEDLENVAKVFTYILKDKKHKVISNYEMQIVHHLILKRFTELDIQ